MKSISKLIKRLIIIICIALALCVALFFVLMFTGVLNKDITENYTHIISVENIDPNNKQSQLISHQPLILDNGTIIDFYADCPDISRKIYRQASDQDKLYLDNGELLCTFPEQVLQKPNNYVYKGKYLLCVGQKWKSLGPMNSIDQPTRRHKCDYVFRVDILNKELDVLFESRAKERVLYVDFGTVITYCEGEIIYYNLKNGQIFKTIDASYMQKSQKYTVSCTGDTLTITTQSGMLVNIAVDILAYEIPLQSLIETSDSDSDYTIQLDAEQAVIKFLDAFKNKDVEDFFSFIDGMHNKKFNAYNSQAYSFIRDIDVDSYKILNEESENEENYPVEFTIELSISKSGTDLFPIGISRWTIIFDPIAMISYVSLFRNAENEINYIDDADKNSIAGFCRDFSFEMDCYKTMTDFNKLIPDNGTEEAGYFCQSLIRCLPLTYDNDYGIKREQLEKAAKNVLGITELDVTKSKFYDQHMDLERIEILSGNWSACSLASEEFDSKSKQRIIIIDYYTDGAYLLKAKTMKYVVRENVDNSFTLISTELIYDSGYEIASFYV